MTFLLLSQYKFAINCVLFLLITSAVVTDLRKQSIYNFQTYTAICLGVLLNFIADGWTGLQMSLLGFVVGFALLFLFYLVGGFGAGDVKFLSAIGALKGATFVTWTMAYSTMVGGIMAMAVMIWKGGVLENP
jgi:prepilin peptidase CpaA